MRLMPTEAAFFFSLCAKEFYRCKNAYYDLFNLPEVYPSSYPIMTVSLFINKAYKIKQNDDGAKHSRWLERPKKIEPLFEFSRCT